MAPSGSLSFGQQTTPATPPQSTQTQPQQGTVLFERHEAKQAPEPQVPNTQTTPADVPAKPSAVNRRTHKRDLQRRDATAASVTPSAETLASAPDAPPEADLSSNVQADTMQEADAKPSVLSPLSEKGAEVITDAERRAVQIERTDLDVHLNRHTGEITASALLVVRNTGSDALPRLPLQISSALRWQSVSMQGSSVKPLKLEQHRLTTDTDHTGAAAEAVIALTSALAPGATIAVKAFYGGSLQQNADRLLRLGAPSLRAQQSDWDTVGDDFSGLRGFGSVLWYPVGAAPAFLADGASFASAVEEQRARPQVFSLRLTVEGQGSPLSEAFFLGRPATLDTVPGPSSGVEQQAGREVVQTAEWPAVAAGPHPVSLFLSDRPATLTTNGLRLATTDTTGVEAFRTAADRVRSMLENWLAPRPGWHLTVLDLPVSNGQPFADGSLLVLPVTAGDPRTLAPALVYPLASAALPPGLPPWLEEGLPEFLRLLYLEQTGGHDRLLAELNAGEGPLAQAESFRTASTPPLADCADPVCARTKAAYVLNMLRQLAGEQPLQQAIVALLAQPSTVQSAKAAVSSSADMDRAGDGAGAKLLALLNKASGKDFRWFFQDWIERDAGLPDLTIVSVAPRKVERSIRTDYLPSQRRPTGGPIGSEPVAQAGDPQKTDSATETSRDRVAPAEGSWLVAVAVRNDGDAAAEVPVTVRAAGLQNSLPLRIPAHSIATVRVPFEAAPEEVWVNDGSTPEVRSVTHHKTIQIPVEAR